MTSVYLDNAATTYPKPAAVLTAFTDAFQNAYGNAGRSAHYAAKTASELLFDTRLAIAEHFGGEAERVVFTQNATHALNLAIKALTPDHGHLLLSDIEHNATLRPVTALGKRGVTYSLYRSFSERGTSTEAILSSLEKGLRQNTVGVIACHRSNCLPIELPLKAIGDFCKKHRLFFIVDASQSAGSADIDLEGMSISVLCAPSHKGLYGLRGAGFALFSKSIPDESIETLIEGGSGSESRSEKMPALLPERLEAGTLPVEVIAAFKAGLDFVKTTTPKRIAEKEAYLARYLKGQLMTLPDLRVYFPRFAPFGTLLFNHAQRDAATLAKLLDERGIALRDGLHCCPLAHRHTKTEQIGALRASFGYFNTEKDADALVYALKDIGGKRLPTP